MSTVMKGNPLHLSSYVYPLIWDGHINRHRNMGIDQAWTCRFIMLDIQSLPNTVMFIHEHI